MYRGSMAQVADIKDGLRINEESPQPRPWRAFPLPVPKDRIHCPRSRSSSFGMGERTIGTYERRSLAVVTRGLQADGGRLTDRLQRPLRDLRISVTDRCNFRCVYCMPKEVFGRDYQFLEREKLLSFEEIARLTRLFASLGVERFALPVENRFFADNSNVSSQCWHASPAWTSH